MDCWFCRHSMSQRHLLGHYRKTWTYSLGPRKGRWEQAGQWRDSGMRAATLSPFLLLSSLPNVAVLGVFMAGRNGKSLYKHSRAAIPLRQAAYTPSFPNKTLRTSCEEWQFLKPIKEQFLHACKGNIQYCAMLFSMVFLFATICGMLLNSASKKLEIYFACIELLTER